MPVFICHGFLYFYNEKKLDKIPYATHSAVIDNVCHLIFEIQAQPLRIEWQQCYGGSDIDGGASVLQSKKGFALFSQTYSNNDQITGNHGKGDFCMIWVDSLGVFLNSKTYGGSDYEYAYVMKPTLDGGFILSGGTFSNNGDVQGLHGSGDLWMVKLDSAGTLEWQRCLGGSSIEYEGNNLAVTADSGYLATGATASNDGDVTENHGGYDFWVAKLDKDGNIKWQKCYGDHILIIH